MDSVVEDLVLDGVVHGVVTAQKDFTSTGCSVVESVGVFDPVIDEEPKNIGRQVERQDDEVDAIVVVQKVDS